MTNIIPFDAAEYLDTFEDEVALLDDAVASGDSRFIAGALGAVARKRLGIKSLAEATGHSRQALHKALSTKGNPTLATLLSVLDELGLQMHIERKVLEDA